MSKSLNIEYKIDNITNDEIATELVKAEQAYESLMNDNIPMTGWIDYPSNISEELIQSINDMANTIKEKYSALVIVGIGGSYLGAAAALDFIIEEQDKMDVKIFFVGINMSSNYHERILRDIKDEDVALCIVSKSGGTTETVVGSNVFLDYLEQRYGKEGKRERVFVVTDPDNGKLRKLATKEGYPTLPIPSDIGGRFSVLSGVGFLPMAVMGIDIREIISGAKSAREKELINKAIKLAAIRNILEDKDYHVELLATFMPSISKLIQWVKQLYGESEGKEGKGMLPVELNYSTDLHSLGQFVQEGRQIFSETFLGFAKEKSGINIPKEWGLAETDMQLTELNLLAEESVIEAHSQAGVPIIDIKFPERSAYAFGQAVYFFQMCCAIRGVMMDINPFDQPGVEKYKEEMRKNLKKL